MLQTALRLINKPHPLLMYLVTIFSAFAMLWFHFNFWPFFLHFHYFTCAPFSVIIFLNALLLVAAELQVIYINTSAQP